MRMPSTVTALSLVFGVALGLMGCDSDDTIALKRFNNPDDRLTLRVTASEELGDPLEIPLRSNTGAIVVGEAEVSPGSGPVGTDHQVLIWVEPDYKDAVIRARVVTVGERGEQVHNLVRDSAEPSLWELKLRSYGEVGEEREDTFRVELWRAADVDEDADFEEDLD
ncbi:MAG: hypothetical protein EA397_14035 [Deltaproteobacteria bacterium]|nr:MAG: hypothetical protein EA397_14035 [Deltaproteobacteria bacterium]